MPKVNGKEYPYTKKGKAAAAAAAKKKKASKNSPENSMKISSY
jgi:hypothetical protein|tara:strand:+ start:808 stop:936 length:129 start_codon:yes stop_codon:yes gene_type:complete